VEEIRGLADAGRVISVGASMQICAKALQKKNPGMRHHHFDHLFGLDATDALVELLLKETGTSQPHPSIIRWRKRLQDAMLDSHFSLGQTRILITAEPDHLAGLCQVLYDAGGRITTALSTVDSPVLDKIPAQKVMVGDLEDAENLHEEFDLMISNFHGEALTKRYHKALVLRGFPIWETLGNSLKNDVLYEGGAYLLFEAANAAEQMRTHGH